MYMYVYMNMFMYMNMCMYMCMYKGIINVYEFEINGKR